MRAVLLAAGLGTRLRPLTLSIPKCLVPIRGKPLLDYWLDHLLSTGVERVLINTHWLAEKVEAHVSQSKWRDQIDLTFERELLGTAGTVFANREWIGRSNYLLAHADNLTGFDFRAFRRRHNDRPADCVMTMLAFRTDSPRSCGILDVDARDVIIGFHEKVENPPGNLANAAVYLCDPEVTDFIASLGRERVDFSNEVIPHFVGRILAHECTGYHRDIGNPEALALAEREFDLTDLSPESFC